MPNQAIRVIRVDCVAGPYYRAEFISFKAEHVNRGQAIFNLKTDLNWILQHWIKNKDVEVTGDA